MHHLPLSRRDALKRVIGLSVALSALEMPAFAQLGARGIGGDPPGPPPEVLQHLGLA